MATNFSILAWRIPRTEEPGELQSIVSQRVEHDWSNGARKQSLLQLSQHFQYAFPHWLIYTPILKGFVNQFSYSGLLIRLFNSYMRFMFLIFWEFHIDSFRGPPTEMPKQTQMPRPIKAHFLRKEPLELYKHRETLPCFLACRKESQVTLGFYFCWF